MISKIPIPAASPADEDRIEALVKRYFTAQGQAVTLTNPDEIRQSSRDPNIVLLL